MTPLWPDALAPLADGTNGQDRAVHRVIERFGRHPHSNAILGRISFAAEEAYVALGAFPHQRNAADVVANT